jgi:Tol biopolymer transport system component/predicted Ser/Thr protein kinase
MTPQMSLAAGERLGPYEILAPLGEGGMGQVYKARDTRLDRIVALKVSKREFTERFEREARAISALNHPHICQLYDVGPNFLVMEFAEGAPIKGPLPLEKALEYSGQILDALDHAHRNKITHRDLKPANIMVTRQGVKLLDFGLAKLETGPLQETDETITQALTKQGQIVGTLQYMSPEQLQGKPADARSDIFSFGAVFYEMLSGKRAFEGSSAASVIAAVLERQPAPLELSPPLERMVLTCVEKDPEKRWQSAREVKHALAWIEAEAPAPAPSRSWLGMVGWIVAAVVLLAAAAWILWPRPSPPQQVMRFEVPLPEKAAITQYVSISPDGRKLAFNATLIGDVGVWVRDFDSPEWRHLAGTEDATAFFWSPDSRSIAFPAEHALKKIDISSGAPQTLFEAPYRLGTGAWNTDGTILFSGTSATPLWKISAEGGTPTQVTSLDGARGEIVHGLPGFLPDGRHFLYLILGSPDVGGIYVGSLDSKPAEQPKQRILETSLSASYAAGRIFFMRGDTLMAQPFDPGKLKVQGEPVRVAERVDNRLPLATFSASPNGVLAYREAPVTDGQLTWISVQTKIMEPVGPPGPYYSIALSPDQTRVAYRDAAEVQVGDIWTLDFARGVRNRLTSGHTLSSNPIWSSDGKSVVYAAGNLVDTLFEKDWSNAGEEKVLYTKTGEPKVPTSWSSDGRFLLYYTPLVPKTGEDLWVLPVGGDNPEARKPVSLLRTPANEREGVFSPNMRWIAYLSDESGRSELYVRPFVASGPSGVPALGDGKWQVSRDGAVAFISWRGDGKEIYFGGPDGGSKAVDISKGPEHMDVPRPLGNILNLKIAPMSGVIAPDGKRWLVSVAQKTGAQPFTVVLNWQALLKK